MAEAPRSRFLDELPSAEAARVMARTSAVILPVGTVELHGPHLPLACDGLISQAFALKLAEKIDALVAPVEPYSFIGATSKFPGGVSVPFSASIEFLKHIVRGLLASGFEKIFLISFHYPNAVALTAVARDMFEETGVPVVNIRPASVVPDELRAKYVDPADGPLCEATLLAGAMRILGKEHLIDVEAWKDADLEHPEPEALRRVMKFGNVGHHYPSEMCHQPPRANVDPGKGAAMLEEAAESCANIADDLGVYIEYLRKKNQGA